MKTRLRIQNKCNFVILGILVISLFLELCLDISRLKLFDFFILNSIISVGVSLIIKSLLFKSDNALWFGLLLICYGVFGWLITFNIVIDLWVYFIVIVPIAIIVGFIFNENIQFKLAVMFLFVSLALYFVNKIDTNYFVLIILMMIMAGYFFQKLIPNKNKG